MEALTCKVCTHKSVVKKEKHYQGLIGFDTEYFCENCESKFTVDAIEKYFKLDTHPHSVLTIESDGTYNMKVVLS